MKIAYSVLAMAAAALPPHLQARYREEWEADLLGAEELGMRRSSVLWGAVLTAFTLSNRVEFSPLQRASAVAYWARWAMGAQLATYVLFLGMYWLGGLNTYSIFNAENPLLGIIALATQISTLAFGLLLFLLYISVIRMLGALIPAPARAAVTVGLWLAVVLALVYAFSTPDDGLSQTRNLILVPLYFTPGLLAFLFYLWAKASGGQVPRGAASLPQARRKLVLFTLGISVLTCLYPLVQLVVFPLLFQNKPLGDFWQEISASEYTVWGEGWLSGLGIALVVALLFYGLILLLAMRCRNGQTAVGMLCLLQGLGFYYYLGRLSYGIDIPGAMYNPTFSATVFEDFMFALAAVIFALGFLLLLAPRVRLVEAATWERTTAHGVLT